MHVYRFNLSLDTVEDFYFEIDIRPSQTFHDFHKVILEVLQFSGTELASFYVSNNLWKKKCEITLIDMSIDEDSSFFDEDEDCKPKKKKILLMDKTKLSDIIDDPHQRFIYIYDFLSPWTVYIEMMKIIEGDDKKKYPLCTKIVGELPTKKSLLNINSTPDDKTLLDESLFDELDDLKEDDENTEEIDTDDLSDDGYDDLKF